MNITEILNSLSKLSQEELQKLNDSLKFYLKYSNDNIEHPEEEMLFNSILDKIKDIIGNTHYFPVLKKSKAFNSKFKEVIRALDDIIHIMEKNIVVTRQIRKSFYNLYASCIFKYLLKYRIPINIMSMLNCYERFLGLLDEEYPGYLENGLLHLIFCPELLQRDKIIYKNK